MSNLSLRNVNKVYPNGVQAVFDFNLDIQDKEFIVFVGPSGCGKSTTLRMIAGLEEISSGELIIDGEIMNEVLPKDRDIAMVFQNYALYPHLSVYDNMAFSLKLRKFPKKVIKEKVETAAEILGLTQYLQRKPKALSGGQRQRVALGRAIVRDAKVFLMDEPLSNLDAKLRVQMRAELIKLHKDLDATTIYVTHDQVEAMTMASRIVVMKDGYIQQVGTPKEVYNNPSNVFVASFIGTPPMNFINGVIDSMGNFVSSDNKLKLLLPTDKVNILKQNDLIDKPIIFGIRPAYITNDVEYISEHADCSFKAKVEVSELLGDETNVYVKVAGSTICASIEPNDEVKMDSIIELAFMVEKCHIFDPESTVNITACFAQTNIESEDNGFSESFSDVISELEEIIGE